MICILLYFTNTQKALAWISSDINASVTILPGRRMVYSDVILLINAVIAVCGHASVLRCANRT